MAARPGRLAIIAAMLLFVVAPVAAHEGAPALIVVPRDQLTQDEPFPVFVVDLLPLASARLSLARGEEIVELGTAQADSFGHFETTLTVPAGYPDGYAELIAESPDGTRAATWVLIGSAGGASPPARAAPPPWWLDPSVIVLVVVLVGGALMVGWRLRGRAA